MTTPQILLSQQLGLKWAPGLFYPTPKWTIEPNIDTIRSLFRQHLGLDEDLRIDVSFLGEGIFNKSYTIAPADRRKDYVFRVSLPVEPFYKTESEVATLSYIRSHTLIPVPRVLAFDASSKNELGFEWILMEKVKGVSLDEIWKGLPEISKISVTKEIAGYVCQLREQCQFTAIGSLYHRKALEKVVPGDKTVKIGDKRDAAFVIGPLVSRFFFLGRRVRIARDRGPFFSDRDYMEAHIRVEIDDMDLLLRSQSSEEGNTTQNGNGESVVEYDEDLAEDAPKIKQSCFDLLSLLSTISPEPLPSGFSPPHPSNITDQEIFEEDEDSYRRHRFVLHHGDLSLSNILMDPETHRITGIIDWECANIHPRWEEDTYPNFLTGPDVEKKPSPLQDEDKDNDLLVEYMQNWEKMQLRLVFDQTVTARAGRDRNDESDDCNDDGVLGAQKKEFMEHLMLVEFSTKAANRWIAKVRDVFGQGVPGDED